MTHVKESGSIQVERKGGPVFRNVRSRLEAETAHARFISFFMAGKIEKTSFGVNRQNGNSFEIVHVTSRQFPGVFRVTVAAHARRLQEVGESSVCLGH